MKMGWAISNGVDKCNTDASIKHLPLHPRFGGFMLWPLLYTPTATSSAEPKCAECGSCLLGRSCDFGVGTQVPRKYHPLCSQLPYCMGMRSRITHTDFDANAMLSSHGQSRF